MLDPNSGIISGTHSSSGTTNIAIGAANAAGHVSATLVLTVTDTGPVISLSMPGVLPLSARAPPIHRSPETWRIPTATAMPMSTNIPSGRTRSIPPAFRSLGQSLSDFGTVAVGTSAQLTFTIGNTGAGTFSGTASLPDGPFTIVSGGSFSIDPGGTAQVVVSFTPQSTGTFQAVLSLASNGGAAAVTLTGQA